MNAHMIRLALVGVIAGSLSLTGCSFLSPSRDPSRFFTLAALPQGAQSPHPLPAASDAHALMYGLGGLVAPFMGIKLLDLAITTVGLVH